MTASAMTPKEKAKARVLMLEEAVLELLAGHPEGLRHADMVRELDIPSDYLGNQRNYLSWSVVGLLMNARRVKRVGNRYFEQEPHGTQGQPHG